MRGMWCRLRAMLRRVVDSGARDAELSEELRAFVEHDTDSKIRERDRQPELDARPRSEKGRVRPCESLR